MLFSLLKLPKKTSSPLNSHNKVEKYCNPIIKILLEEALCKNVFKKAINIIIELIRAKIEDKEALKNRKR